MTVTLVVSNNQDKENMIPIAHELRQLAASVRFFLPDARYRASIRPDLIGAFGEAEIIEFPRQSPGPIHGDSGALAMGWQSVRGYRTLLNLARESSGLCIGTLDAHERTLTGVAGRHGLRTVYVQPSFMWPTPGRPHQTSRLLRRGVQLLGDGLRIPGLMNRADGRPLSQVDAAVGLGVSGRLACERMGLSGRYIGCGIPRLPVTPVDGSQTSAVNNQVVYATGAYQWHGYGHLAHVQRSQVATLLDWIGRDRLRVRVHPRDDPNQYARDIRPDAGTSALPASERSTVVSLSSTYSLEAALKGMPSYFWWPDNFNRILHVSLDAPEWQWVRPMILSDRGAADVLALEGSERNLLWNQSGARENLVAGLGVGGDLAARVVANELTGRLQR